MCTHEHIHMYMHTACLLTQLFTYPETHKPTYKREPRPRGDCTVTDQPVTFLCVVTVQSC